MSQKFWDTCPKEFRRVVSQGGWKKPTSGVCLGYKQANVAILPKYLANDFESICRENHGPLPILQRIEDCTQLFKEVPRYCLIKNRQRTLTDTLQIENVDNFTGFLLGCSFSFEDLLLKNGVPVRNIEQNKNVSMFTTTVNLNHSKQSTTIGGQVSGIDTQRYGDIKMVVSMRPIPRSQLKKVYELSSKLGDCHGAPIAIGADYARVSLGVQDVKGVDYGDTVEFQKDDVACFWCCGVTGINVVDAFSRLFPEETFITHAPGFMYVTDLSADEQQLSSKNFSIVEYHKDHFIPIVDTNAGKLNQLEQFLSTSDPGKRGLKNWVVESDFQKAVYHLASCYHVLLTTGFPAVMSQELPYETDGLPGIQVLARALESLGKKVTILVDRAAKAMTIETFKNVGEEYRVVTLDDEIGDDFDVILTSERTSRNRDTGKYKTMRMLDMDERFIDPIDDFINTWREQSSGNLVISIGDGGNEFGMGKIKNKYCTAVDSCDFLIGAGVSNWGCYALCAGLQILLSDYTNGGYPSVEIGYASDLHYSGRYLNHGLRSSSVGLLLNYEVCKEYLIAHEKCGVRDGCKPEQRFSVDGMKFDQEHYSFITHVRTKILDMTNTTNIFNSHKRAK